MIKAWLYKNEYGTDIVLIPPTDEDFYHYAGRNTKVNTPAAYTEVVITPLADYEEVQAVLGAAEKALNNIIAQLDCFMGQVKLCSLNSGAERQLMAIGDDLPKARETLAQIQEVTK